MSQGFQTVHCPQCGGRRLQGYHDASKEKHPLRGRGLLLLLLIGRKKVVSRFWICQDCGTQFPIES